MLIGCESLCVCPANDPQQRSGRLGSEDGRVIGKDHPNLLGVIRRFAAFVPARIGVGTAVDTMF
ncbi:hypothetical protein HNR25_001796 [Streptomonospora salina]|uniref:Uncharacterized protein n=1 Tax=Streptomonospora salina TaxID=104205 RepID=A0A841E4H0_9ACTN|nr:hypothetical protein [Streptomonospora salina]